MESAPPIESASLTRKIRIAFIILFCLGVAGRARQYFARTSFWGDEAFVVMNVRLLTPLQLAGKLVFRLGTCLLLSKKSWTSVNFMSYFLLDGSKSGDEARAALQSLSHFEWNRSPVTCP